MNLEPIYFFTKEKKRVSIFRGEKTYNKIVALVTPSLFYFCSNMISVLQKLLGGSRDISTHLWLFKLPGQPLCFIFFPTQSSLIQYCQFYKFSRNLSYLHYPHFPPTLNENTNKKEDKHLVMSY